MTTDTDSKEVSIDFTIGGKTCRMGAIAKGSGMIHPNMGTMLLFITTDCASQPEMLQEALPAMVPATFNRVTVDGDTSTNDTCVVLANGMAGNPRSSGRTTDYDAFRAALTHVCRHTLAREHRR